MGEENENPGVIVTERLDLLPLLPAHSGEMAAVLSDPALYAFTGGEPPAAAELLSRYQRWAAGSGDPAVTWCNWALRLRAEGCLAGTVQATITGPPAHRAADVAWVVGTPWQGRGIAKEAARGLVSWLRQHAVRTVAAYIHPDHRASAAVAAAAGLAPTSEMHDGEVRWCLRLPCVPRTGGKA